MSRIKKRGLDYFPLNTDFIQNRIVRRIMKRNGDSALATLLAAFHASMPTKATTCVPTIFSTKISRQACTTPPPTK